MKIYIRLVKGKGLYDRIIKWYTRSEYTHAEFAWPLCHKCPDNWYGAQPQGGVQIRPGNYLPWKYDLFCIDVSQSEYRHIEAWLLLQKGKPYDWKAIINMGLFKHDVSSFKRWFCSELVFCAFAYFDIPVLRAPLNQRDRITPRDLGISERMVRVKS